MLFVLVIIVEWMNSFGYDNLSFGRSAVQSSTSACTNLQSCTYSTYKASNAVDGDDRTCTRTRYIGENNADDKVWWYVDLGGIHSVYDIRIQFKDYKTEYGYSYLWLSMVARQQKNLAGFSLYISNTTRQEDGELCYRDLPTLGLPDLDFITRCIKYGRFVIFYNERLRRETYPQSRYEDPALTELCNVVVRGCYRTGVYGYSCNIYCPTNCQERRCDIVNGHCLGCTPGWSGSKCNQACPSGLYGLECKSRCSGNCRYSDICNHVTGRCGRGCTSGWKDNGCDKYCNPGTYGPNCVNTCSGHCFIGVSCNRVTGKCDNGCDPGYTGELCDTECLPGYFGMHCENTCSGHCLHNQSCHHVDGVCKNGCAVGYTGRQCFNICAPGFFGMKCKETCSNSCLETCNHIDGFCSCAPGWMDPPKCNKECPEGFFGVDCGFQCSENCVNNETCNRFEGTCDEGCQGSYSGLICDHQVLISYREVDCGQEGPSPALITVITISALINFTGLIICVLSLRSHMMTFWKIRKNARYIGTEMKSTSQNGEDCHTYEEINIEPYQNLALNS